MASVDTDSYTAIPVYRDPVARQYTVTDYEFTFCDCHHLYWHELEMYWLDDVTPICDITWREQAGITTE